MQILQNTFLQIDPKPCNPRAGMVRSTRRNLNGYKVFLGGLPSNLTETDMRNFFSQYGKVTEVVIMYDQEKKKSRGQSTFIQLNYGVYHKLFN